MASADFGQEARARRDEPTAVVPLGSWRLAWRRLSRNPAAVAAALVLAAIVVACLCAPLFAEHVAHTGPNTPHYTDTVRVGDRTVPVLRPETEHLRSGLNLPYYAPIGAGARSRSASARPWSASPARSRSDCGATAAAQPTGS